MGKDKLKVLIFFFLAVLNINSFGQWSHMYAPRFRTIKSINILDLNHIIMVGGNETNDPIQYILQTSDGGQNWNMVTDSVSSSSWLTSSTFINGEKGFAVGKNGKILKTTNSGNSWSVVSSPSMRNFNDVCFVDANVGFIVGGNKSNDSIQTILKTVDGGTSWSIVRDVMGYWLKSIYFVSTSVGFCVGEHGTILKSVDGGTNWTSITVSSSVSDRAFNDVVFTDSQHGIIIGGIEGHWQTNDSVQTILETMDGGNTWNVVRDVPGPCLNAICFSDNNTGLIAGNSGTLLKTFNSGGDWEQVSLPDNTPDNNFYAVHFLTNFYGYVAGQYGIIYKYVSDEYDSPFAETGEVSFEGSDVVLHANVKGNTASAQVFFEYGSSLAYDHEIASVPATITDTNLQFVSVRISGLSLEHTYNYRVKVVSNVGTVAGVNKKFYLGANPIPNWDFENWQIDTMPIPESWKGVMGIVTKEVSYDGSWCAMLKSDSVQKSAGVVLLSMVDDNPLTGGVPFAYRPDTLICWLNYSIPQNDTGYVLLALKSQGATISQKFYPLTGSTSNQFIEQKLKIDYTSTNVPDSIVMGFVNTNPFNDQNTYTNGAFLAVDNIRFNTPVPSLPNFDFEQWTQYIYTKPEGWYAEKYNFNNEGFYNTTALTTDRYLHDRAVLISNNIVGAKMIKGEMTTVKTRNDIWQKPSFPIVANYQFLTGYYKFEQENGDTAFVNVRLFKNGVNMANGEYLFTQSNNDYMPFIVPIQYQDPNQEILADSATIIIHSYRSDVRGNSKLWLDALSFDGAISNSVSSIVSENRDVLLFPNPCNQFFTLNFSNQQAQNVTIRLFDLSGRCLKTILEQPLSQGGHQINVNTEDLSNGCYFCILYMGNEKYCKKVIVN